jgi:pimeloyl-ACP methyl ester carboxylesterase
VSAHGILPTCNTLSETKQISVPSLPTSIDVSTLSRYHLQNSQNSRNRDQSSEDTSTQYLDTLFFFVEFGDRRIDHSMDNPSKAPFKPTSYASGILYSFTPDLTAYEHAPSTVIKSLVSSTLPTSTLVFINGMYGTPLSTKYTLQLAAALPSEWRLVEPLLSSSGTGFGTGSLDQDVEEVGRLVEYIRSVRPGGDVVLLGHSTGCQDAIHYLCAPGRDSRFQKAPVEGVILQAPVSDREASNIDAPEGRFDEVDGLAQELVKQGKGEDLLPFRLTQDVYPRVPMSARRWLSLLSPDEGHTGEDDYFSSDLSMERFRQSFGNGGGGVKWLVLHGEVDSGVPKGVDKERLLEQWRQAVEEGGGVWDEECGVLKGADHALTECPQETRDVFVEKVVKFLGTF